MRTKMKHIYKLAVLVALIGLVSPLFSAEITVFGPKKYTRKKGKPVTVTDSFTSPVAGNDFILKVTNGNDDPGTRVASAVIKLNGKEILGPSDFSTEVDSLTRIVSVESSNEISVQLRSKPGSFLTIQIVWNTVPVTVNLTADPTTIALGESSSLTWTSSGADSVVIDNGIGEVPLNGTWSVSPTVSQTTYTITATGVGGQATATATVYVQIPEPTVAISADPATIRPHQSSVLSWTSQNAQTVSIDQGIGTVDPVGTFTVEPTETTVYTITAVGHGGTATASTTVVFVPDTTPPEIVISSPANGAFLNITSVGVSGTVTDEFAISAVTVNGTPVTLDGSNFSATANLAEGSNTISVRAVDEFNNENTVSVVITRDTVNPVIQIVSPQFGSLLAATPIEVTGTVDDANPLRITLNGSEGNLSGNSFTFSGVALQEGPNSFTLMAEDRAGNTVSEPLNVTLDSTPPVITVTSPAAGDVLNTGSVTVTGSITDASDVTEISVNDISAQLVTGGFECLNVPLTEGENTLQVTAVDAAGNGNSIDVPVVLDSQAPQIVISEPTENDFLNSNQVWIRGTVTDSTDVTLTVNNNTIPLTNGSFEIQLTLQEGSNTVTAVATDAGSNQSEAAISITIDTVMPQIEVAFPIDNSVVNNPQMVVNGIITETNPDTILLNGTISGTIDGNGFTFPAVDLAPGENQLTVLATDKAGNQNSVMVNVTLDTVSPVITISEPAEGTFFNQPAVTIRGSVSDDSEVTLTMNGNPVVLTNNAFEVPVTLIEGPNTFTFVATDAGTNAGTLPLGLLLDTTPPQIVINQPADGSFSGTTAITVNGAVTDATDVTVQVNGQDVPLTDNQFDTSLTLIEGGHTITVTAIDQAGNTNSATAGVTVDTTPPQVQITSPADQAVINEMPIQVSGTVTDTNLLKVVLNGTVEGSVTGNQFTFSNVSLNVNLNTLTVVAEDKAGNTATHAVGVTYIPDSEPPVVTITSPQADFCTNEGTLTVTGTATDENSIPTLTVNGVPAQLTGDQFTANVTLTEGNNTITVVTTDEFDNTRTVTVPVTLDTIPPVITVTEPAADAFLQNLTVSLVGTVQDASPVTLTVNGNQHNLSGAGFDVPVTLQEGINELSITATDCAGNLASHHMEVFIDSIPPQISINSPLNDAWLGSSPATITGTVTDENLLRVMIGDREAELTGNQFSFSDMSIQPGANTFLVEAFDRAGNRGEAGLTVHLDSSGPQMTITEPISGILLSQKSVLVRGTVSDDHLETVKVNGLDCQVDSGQYQVMATLGEGPNTITAVATDIAGNTTQAQVSLTVDTIQPAVTVHSPADGSVLSTPSIAITGSVTDAHPATVSVNDQNAVLTDGNFSLSSLSLVNGENTITVNATDGAGHTGQQIIRVVLDTEPPAITGVAPDDGTAGVPLDSVITITFSEPVNPATVDSQSVVVRESGGDVLAGTILVQGNEVSWTPSQPFADSTSFSITVAQTITDMAGNGVTASYDGTFVSVDSSAPAEPQINPVPESTGLSVLTVSGTTEPDCHLRIDGGASIVTTQSDSSGSFSVEVSLKENQLNQLCITATDDAGNPSVPACVATLQDGSDFVVSDADFSGNAVRIVFSRELDPNTVNTASLVVKTGSGIQGGTIQVLNGNKECTFIPAADLTGQMVVVEVKTLVKDKDGILLSFPFSRIFNQTGGEVVVQGEVYDDHTGKRLAGAMVTLIDVNGTPPQEPVPSTVTTLEGQYVLLVPSGRTVVRIVKEGYLPSDRVVLSTSELSSGAFDSRLDPVQSDPYIVGSAGGSFSNGDIQLMVPGGAVTSDTPVRIDSVGDQSLQGRLPLGWSPLLAVDIHTGNGGDISFTGVATLQVPNSWPGVTGDRLVLGQWDETVYKWKAASSVFVSQENLSASINAGGQYAILIADSIPVVPPAPSMGQELAGVEESSVIPQTPSVQFGFDPNEIYPGETSEGTMVLSGSSALTSGVAVQAHIQENYTLISNDQSSFPTYMADLTSYTYGGAESKVVFSVSPDRRIQIQDLSIGTIKTDMKRFQTSGFGMVVGPDGGTVTGSGGTEVIIAAGSVEGLTAVSIGAVEVSEISVSLPEQFTVVGALDLSFGGTVLASAAEISMPVTGIPVDAQLFAVQLKKIDAEFAWTLRSVCQVDQDRIKSETNGDSGLPLEGVREGGIYLFLQANNPVGYITGSVTDSGQPLVDALVQVDGSHELSALSHVGGTYVQLGFLGDVALLALNRISFDEGTANGSLGSEGEILNLDIQILQTGPEVVSITPESGAADIPLQSNITIVFSEAVQASTFGSQTVSVRADGQVVGGVFKLSADGTVGEFVPTDGFPSEAAVTVSISTDLQDLSGNPMAEAYSSGFSIVDATPPRPDYDLIQVRIPSSGVSTIVGLAGAATGADRVEVFNERTGTTQTISVQSDGSFEVSIAAELGDVLKITIYDDHDNSIVLDHKPFVSEDGTRVVFDEKGGEYIAPAAMGGIGILIEEGTFTRPVQLGIQPLTDSGQMIPALPDSSYITAVKVDLDGAVAHKPFKLSIPANGVTDSSRIFISEDYYAFGKRYHHFVDSSIVRDGRIYSASPYWPGSTRNGTYYWNKFTADLVLLTGNDQPGHAIIINGAITVEPQWIVPVYKGKNYDLTVKDMVSGEVLYETTRMAGTVANQIYEFGPISIEQDPPLPVRTTGVCSYRFHVVQQKVTSRGISVEISEQTNDGKYNVRLIAEAGTAATYNDQDSDTEPVKIRVYTPENSELMLMKEFDADGDGSFNEVLSGMDMGDILILTIEKGNLPLRPEMILTFSEPLVDVSDTNVNLLLASDESMNIEMDVELLPSKTDVRIRPKLNLKEGKSYKLSLTNISDYSGNAISMDFNFRTQVTDPLSKLPGFGIVTDLLMHGNYIYVATGGEYLKMMDVSNPLVPRIKAISTSSSDKEIRGLAVWNDQENSKTYLVAVGGGGAENGTIKLFDLEDGWNPQFVNSQQMTDRIGENTSGMPEGKPWKVRVHGHNAFVVVHSYGMMIIDLRTVKSGGPGAEIVGSMQQSNELYPVDLQIFQRKKPSDTNPDELVDQVVAVLQYNYFGIVMVDVTNAASMKTLGIYEMENRVHIHGLELAQNYWVDVDEDSRRGIDEDQDNDAHLDKDELKDFVFFNIPDEKKIVILDITDPETPVVYGRVEVKDGIRLGDMQLNENKQILYVNDRKLGLVSVDMSFTGEYFNFSLADQRVLSVTETSGDSEYGLLIDEDLNIAYSGQLGQGVDILKVANPVIKLVYKDPIDGSYKEVPKTAPIGLQDKYQSGIKNLNDKYPDTVYVMALLPGGLLEGTTLDVEADLEGLNPYGGPVVTWDDDVKTRLSKIKLTRREDDPLKREYKMYLSDPIKVTLKGEKEEGDGETVNYILSSDFLKASFNESILTILSNTLGAEQAYLSEEDLRVVFDKKPSIRADIIDREENFKDPPEGEEVDEKSNSPANNPSTYNGVLLHSGELNLAHTDLSVPGRGFDFNFTRSYRSQATYSGPLGWGWDHSYNRRLLVLYSGDVLYYDGTGRRERYRAVKDEEGTITGFQSPKGRFTEMGRLADGSYYNKYPDGTVEYFDMFGMLTKIKDRNRNFMEFFNDPDGKMVAAMDTMGRYVEFEYSPFTKTADESGYTAESGRLKAVTDIAGRKVTFAYETGTGNLITADNFGRSHTYAYFTNDDLKLDHNLKSFSDPKGNEYSFAYDSENNDKVATQTLPDDINPITISFTFDTALRKATVTDGKLNVKTFSHDDSGNPIEIQEGEFTTYFNYTTDGLIQNVNYPRGNSITYTYNNGETGDPANLDTRRSQANVTLINEIPTDGGGDARITRMTYEKFYNQVESIIHPNGLNVNHDIRENGNIYYAYTNLPDINYTYDYYKNGQLKFEINGSGLTTNYSYHPEVTPGGSVTTISGRGLDSVTGGYLLKSETVGSSSEEFKEYDAKGALKEYLNSKEIISTYVVNDHGEVETETVSADVGGSPNPTLLYEGIYTYDDNGNMSTRTVKNGDEQNEYTYDYDKRNNLKSETEVGRGSTNYTYDANDNLTNIIDEEGKTVDMTYDGRDLIDTMTVGTDGTYTFKYDGNGNMYESIDARNKTTSYGYDGFDRLQTITDLLGNQTVITRTNLGNTVTVERLDPVTGLLRQTTTVKDPVGRILSYSITGPGGVDESYSYVHSDSGKTITVTDSMGRESVVKKNNFGQVIEQRDPAGNITEFYYEDGRNNMTRKVEILKATDGTTETYTTRYEYNAFNKVRKITDPANDVTTLTYTRKGELESVIDPLGNNVSHEYDSFGRRTKTTKLLANGSKIETRFEYYDNNLLWKIYDSSNNMTEYFYDSDNRVSKITYPDTTTREFTYDGNGNVETEKQRNGTVITNTYDDASRLDTRAITRVAGVGGTTAEDYDYDGLNRVIRAADDDSTVEFQYDALNRVTQETQQGQLIEYTYAKVGNHWKTTLKYPNQRIIERELDVMDRMTAVREGGTDIASFNLIGKQYRMLNKQYGNGDTIQYLYNLNRRTTSVKSLDKNLAAINHYTYDYYKSNMRKSETKVHENNFRNEYNYDGALRLTEATYDVNPDPQTGQMPYRKKNSIQLDRVDNILNLVTTTPRIENDTVVEDTSTISTVVDQASNRYTQFDQWGLSYDGNGNTTQKGTQQFTYDYRNQMVEVDDGIGTVNYKYDALGRRIEKAAGSQVTKYFYDGRKVIEERDGADTVLKQFVNGNGIDEVIRIDKYDGGTATPYYYHTNASNNVTAITDSQGEVKERYDYNLYGMPTIYDENGQEISESAIGNEYMFHSRRYDRETNLYYYRARSYDPIMGRFLQTDPMGYQDSMNLYQAFNMNGVNYLDPWGLMEIFLFVRDQEMANEFRYNYENRIPYINLIANTARWKKHSFHYIILENIIKKRDIAAAHEEFNKALETEDSIVVFVGHSNLENSIYLGSLGERQEEKLYKKMKNKKKIKSKIVALFSCSSSRFASDLFLNQDNTVIGVYSPPKQRYQGSVETDDETIREHLVRAASRFLRTIMGNSKDLFSALKAAKVYLPFDNLILYDKDKQSVYKYSYMEGKLKKIKVK